MDNNPEQENPATDSHIPLIAHVVYFFGTGGMENGVVNLINNLPADQYRHMIICLSGYTEFRDRLNQPVEFISLNKKEGKDFGVYLRLWKVLRRYKPDIVHTRNLAALAGQIPAFLAGIKKRIHGEHGRDVFDLHGKHRKYNLYRKIFSLFVQRYITVSMDLENWLKDELSISADRITHIYNGVDTERFAPVDEKNSNHALPFEPGKIVMGTVGRLVAVKDQMTLLDSFTHLIRQEPELAEVLRLVIVGEGDLRAMLEARIEQNNLQDLVWMAGDRRDIPELLPQLDIFVLPSLGEGISNTLLEAMSCGLPVIATAVGGNVELVDEGQTGFLVPAGQAETMASAISILIRNTSLRRLMGQAGRFRVEQEFSLGKMVEGYKAVYDALVTS